MHAALSCHAIGFSTRPNLRSWKSGDGNPRSRVFCSQNQVEAAKRDYKPSFVDDLFLELFRKKMVEEVGWNSEKLGYDGLIEVASRLMMKSGSNLMAEQSSVRILKSLFPSTILFLFKMLIAPIGGGRLASMMVARATAWSCQWLMGPCSVNSVDLSDGSSCSSGVLVERCKYLEQSKCVGICINTCKLPTQTFFKDQMGVPLYMEPKFSDYSCQFSFGVLPPSRSSDNALHEPCLEICPNANRRKELNKSTSVQCPKA